MPYTPEGATGYDDDDDDDGSTPYPIAISSIRNIIPQSRDFLNSPQQYFYAQAPPNATSEHNILSIVSSP
jgi:hypothetical protein